MVLVVIGLVLIAVVSRVSKPVEGRVVKVYDGDTVAIELGGRQFKCRLIGIDAPEMSYSRLWEEMDKVSKYAPVASRKELSAAKQAFRKWTDVMEAQAGRARDELGRIVNGKSVRLAYDSKEPERDRYGRLLVYVSVDGADVNAEMIRRGLAVADTRFGCDRLDEYVKLQQAAQAAHVGLWATTGKSAKE